MQHECLGFDFALKQFYHYLLGRFTVIINRYDGYQYKRGGGYVVLLGTRSARIKFQYRTPHSQLNAIDYAQILMKSQDFSQGL